MKSKLITIAFLLTTASTMAVECTALKSYDNGRNYVTVEEKLTAVPGFQGKVQADVEDAYFTFSKVDNGQYSAKIIMAPDYQNGVSTLASFDTSGKFSMAKVVSSTRYVLTCTK